jgi:RNA polymerase sigma-70 factor (family 1)
VPDPTLDNEIELFVRIARGDESAFQPISHHYNRELLPFIIKLTGSREAAEEVIQEVFLRLWQQRDKLSGIRNPRAWIIRIASNISITYLRKQTTESRLYERLKAKPSFNATPENELATKEITKQIREAVLRLNPSERRVFELSRDRGMSIPEIAESLGLSPHTVKNQLSAALKAIRSSLSKVILLIWIIISTFF